MRKITLIVLFVLGTFSSQSQVLNSSFENLAPNGNIKNWGFAFLRQYTLDSNGVFQGDSIVFDNDLYFSTNDAHTGTKALEMRNAFNYTTNQKIAGMAKLTPNDTDYAAFAPMVSISQRPGYFSFYYKFLPAASDTAFAGISISDSNGVEIGNAIVEITNATSVYSLISRPIIYANNDPAAFISINFCTSKPGSSATFGTRFLVDDVNLLPSGIKSQTIKTTSVRCFPNPTQDLMMLTWEEPIGEKATVEILDANGKITRTINLSGSETNLKVDTSELPEGAYFINLIANKNKFTTTLIK